MRASSWGVIALSAVFLVAAASAAPVPKKQGEEVFLVKDSDGTKFLSTNGGTLAEWKSHHAALSPDGKLVAGLELLPAKPRPTEIKSECVIRDRAGQELHRVSLVHGVVGSAVWFVWSADGRRLFIGEHAGGRGRANRYYDLASGEVVDVTLPDESRVSGWSADSKRLLVGHDERLAWYSLDGKSEPEYLTAKEDKIVGGGKLSPDGTRILYRSRVETKYKGAEYQLFVFDLKAKKRARVTTADDGVPDSYCWSPDGRRVAYTWRQAFENPDGVTECDTKLITSNPDGSDPKTIATRTYKGQGAAGVGHFFLRDWR